MATIIIQLYHVYIVYFGQFMQGMIEPDRFGDRNFLAWFRQDQQILAQIVNQVDEQTVSKRDTQPVDIDQLFEFVAAAVKQQNHGEALLEQQAHGVMN